MVIIALNGLPCCGKSLVLQKLKSLGYITYVDDNIINNIYYKRIYKSQSTINSVLYKLMTGTIIKNKIKNYIDNEENKDDNITVSDKIFIQESPTREINFKKIILIESCPLYYQYLFQDCHSTLQQIYQHKYDLYDNNIMENLSSSLIKEKDIEPDIYIHIDIPVVESFKRCIRSERCVWEISKDITQREFILGTKKASLHEIQTLYYIYSEIYKKTKKKVYHLKATKSKTPIEIANIISLYVQSLEKHAKLY